MFGQKLPSILAVKMNAVLGVRKSGVKHRTEQIQSLSGSVCWSAPRSSRLGFRLGAEEPTAPAAVGTITAAHHDVDSLHPKSNQHGQEVLVETVLPLVQ